VASIRRASPELHTTFSLTTSSAVSLLDGISTVLR
jgi:hypothetical protein